jgi:hypothetical protein
MKPSAQPAAGGLPVSVTEPVALMVEQSKCALPPVTVGNETVGKASNLMWEDPGFKTAAIEYTDHPVEQSNGRLDFCSVCVTQASALCWLVARTNNQVQLKQTGSCSRA